MRLITKYKESYDWAAHNGDTHLTWVRNEKYLGGRWGSEGEEKTTPVRRADIPGDVLQFMQECMTHRVPRVECRFSYDGLVHFEKHILFVGSRLFSVVTTSSYDREKEKDMVISDTEGSDSTFFMARLVDSPVGMVSFYEAQRDDSGDRFGWTGYRNPPISHFAGLMALLPDPQQLVQEIEYTLGNRMHSSPDQSPADKRTDKEKIVSAGFDVKQSFRHRKSK